MLRKVVLGLLTTVVLSVVIALALVFARVDMTVNVLAHALFGTGTETPEEAVVRSTLKVPEGFSVGVFAGGVTNARFMEFTGGGDLVVAQPRESKVTLLLADRNGDGASDGRRVLLDHLTRPHSVAFHDGYLYIAESNAVGRVGFDHASGTTRGQYVHIITGLEDGGNHWTKTIGFGPDGRLYLSSGSPCNVCIVQNPRRAAMTRYQPDGSGEEIFATGLRNSVGFDWSPDDGALYATDNGRDLLGDDYPPCELNKIEQGKFYGWPYINGFGDLDPDFGDESRLADSTAPVHGFRAHNAPLGMRFIDIETFPAAYRGAALVALHGSWNRSTHDGYKVVSLHRTGNGSFEERDFLSGFESGGSILGRPVDVDTGPDGCVYVSDDYAMAVYRVCHGGGQTAELATRERAGGETGLETLSATDRATLAAQGEELFRTRGCPACHSLGQQPTPGLKPLRNLAATYGVDSLRAYFKSPTPPMPPVSTSDEELLALSVYLLQRD